MGGIVVNVSLMWPENRLFPELFAGVAIGLAGDFPAPPAAARNATSGCAPALRQLAMGRRAIIVPSAGGNRRA